MNVPSSSATQRLIPKDFSALPKELFCNLLLPFFSFQDAANLSAVNHKFKDWTIGSFRSARLKQIKDLVDSVDIFNKNSKYPSVFQKIGRECELEMADHSTKSVFLIQQCFLNFFEKITVQIQSSLKESQFEEIRKKFKDRGGKSPIFIMDFDVLSILMSGPKGVRETPFGKLIPPSVTTFDKTTRDIIEKHGTQYFPLALHRLDRFVDHLFRIYNRGLSLSFSKIGTNLEPVITCLLNKNMLREAVYFVNAVIDKWGMDGRNKDSYPLHVFIIKGCLEKGDLSGAIRVVKAISIDFKETYTEYLEMVIRFALDTNDEKAIMEISDMLRLDLSSKGRSTLSFCLHHLIHLYIKKKDFVMAGQVAEQISDQSEKLEACKYIEKERNPVQPLPKQSWAFTSWFRGLFS